MALVERGAAPLGIVYATDARASRRVRVVGVFPAPSHPPNRYPVALLVASRPPEAAAFRAFLVSKQSRPNFEIGRASRRATGVQSVSHSVVVLTLKKKTIHLVKPH